MMISKVRPASPGLHAVLVAGGLAPAAAEALAAIPHDRITVDPRQPFREPGALRNEVMFVERGILAKSRVDTSGNRQIVALRYASEGILPGEGRLGVSLRAIVPTTLLVGKASDLDAIIARHPEIAAFFVKLLQRENRINYEWLTSCGRRDSLARVAHFLLEMARRTDASPESDGMANPFTQAEIADMTGQTSVNVNRMFARLERDGMIRREGKRIFFLDTEAMRRRAEFDASYLA